MNQEAQAELNRILALDVAELSESDQAFLQARRSYLTEEQKIKFGVSEPVEAESSEESQKDEGSTDEAPKKAKKVK